MDYYSNRMPLFPIREALGCYRQGEFVSPYRSTVPLLSWLKQERQMVRSLFRALGVPSGCGVHLEYQVAPPQGQGAASHTDLMVIAGDTALAVEAKWTEPSYKIVQDWLPTVDPVNGPVVLGGWLGLLQAHATHRLDPVAFNLITYQMVHRAASACEAGREPILAYLLFFPSPKPQTATSEEIGNQLSALRALLGHTTSFPFFLVEIHLTPTALFDALVVQQAEAEDVQAAIAGDQSLFAFEKYSVQSIG